MARTKNRGRGPKQQIRDADKRSQALTLRRQGLNYDEIAQRMGYANRGAAQQLVKRALEELWVEPAEDVRKLELLRLDKSYRRLERIIVAHIDEACEPGSVDVNPETGEAKVVVSESVRAVIEAMKVQVVVAARRAKYLGLEAAQKHEHTGKDGGAIEIAPVTADELLERISRLAATVGAGENPTEPVAH